MPEQEKQPDAKVMMSNIGTLFVTFVASWSACWSMFMRKPGTVGTRAYNLELFYTFLALIALAGTPNELERILCFTVMALTFALHIRHMIATWGSKKHVHTRCIGAYRFSKQGLPETILGVGIGTALYYGGLPFIGGFIGGSAFCCPLRDVLIQERDKLRSIQMADALAEQEYMMNSYERFQK